MLKYANGQSVKAVPTASLSEAAGMGDFVTLNVVEGDYVEVAQEKFSAIEAWVPVVTSWGLVPQGWRFSDWECTPVILRTDPQGSPVRPDSIYLVFRHRRFHVGTILGTWLLSTQPDMSIRVLVDLYNSAE